MEKCFINEDTRYRCAPVYTDGFNYAAFQDVLYMSSKFRALRTHNVQNGTCFNQVECTGDGCVFCKLALDVKLSCDSRTTEHSVTYARQVVLFMVGVLPNNSRTAIQLKCLYAETGLLQNLLTVLGRDNIPVQFRAWDKVNPIAQQTFEFKYPAGRGGVIDAVKSRQITASTKNHDDKATSIEHCLCSVDVDAIFDKLVVRAGTRLYSNIADGIQFKIKYPDASSDNESEKEYASVRIDKELVQDVSVRIVQNLCNDPNSLWCDCIILSHKVMDGRTVSLGAFSKAINSIVKQCLPENHVVIKAELLEREKVIQSYLNDAWDIVQEKWPCSLTLKDNSKNDKPYNIYKSVGVFALYGLLSECLMKANGSFEESLIDFKQILMNSKVCNSDWLVGGRFTGMNTTSLTEDVISIIKNVENV